MKIECSAFIDNVVDCGEHFKIATCVGPETMELKVQKQEGLCIKQGDGMKGVLDIQETGISVDKNIELWRNNKLYAKATLV